jgi:hypothetical protein
MYGTFPFIAQHTTLLAQVHVDFLLILHKNAAATKQKKEVCLGPKEDIKLANIWFPSTHYHRNVAMTDSAPLTSQRTVLNTVYMQLYRQVGNND